MFFSQLSQYSTLVMITLGSYFCLIVLIISYYAFISIALHIDALDEFVGAINGAFSLSAKVLGAVFVTSAFAFIVFVNVSLNKFVGL